MDFLMENTNFTKQQIKAWYSGFMVRTQLSSFVSTRASVRFNIYNFIHHYW